VRWFALLCLGVCLAGPAFASTGFEASAATPTLVVTGSPLALASASISSFGEDPLKAARHKKKRKHAADSLETSDNTVFGVQRTRILLRSLTVPGWGQASLGRRHSAAFFGVTELGIWTAFTAFRIQDAMRTDTYLRTAKLFAGIDLSGRSEEYRRIVGAYSSSDEYNLLVVARDAANLFMADVTHPNMVAFRAYIAAHSLKGSDAWNWTDENSFLLYAAQRQNAQKASIRANTALAVAIVNRLVSAVHAARAAGKTPMPAAHTSWNVNFAPGDPGERVLFRTGLSARF